MPIVDQMAKGETPTHARLGVSVSNVGATEQRQTGAEVGDGAQIQEVNAGSTAADAGIDKGDVITKIDDHLITDADSLVATIRSYRPGDTVTVTYVHDGDHQDRRAHPRLGLGGVQQLRVGSHGDRVRQAAAVGPHRPAARASSAARPSTAPDGSRAGR